MSYNWAFYLQMYFAETVPTHNDKWEFVYNRGRVIWSFFNPAERDTEPPQYSHYAPCPLMGCLYEHVTEKHIVKFLYKLKMCTVITSNVLWTVHHSRLSALKSAHVCSLWPLHCRWRQLIWAPVQQLNSPLLRAAIICGSIYLSQRAVWITTSCLMANCHMMSFIIYITSSATHPVSSFQKAFCRFQHLNPPSCGNHKPSIQ